MCDLSVNGTGAPKQYGASAAGVGTATVVQTFTVHKGQKIVESCEDNGSNTTDVVLNASITAIKMVSSKAGSASPAVVRNSHPDSHHIG